MKPYIICYMMTSLDGRIDCAMTAQLKGVDNYYKVLNELNIPTTVSGRHTAELEMANPGKFNTKDLPSIGKDGYSKKADAKGYEVIVDTKGTLLWNKQELNEKPLLIIMSQKTTQAYLDYLDQQNISWLVAGKDHIDLAKAMDILNMNFGVQRVGVVGGPTINTGFLNAGLLDEVDILIGPGIDGRKEMPSVFEGREEEKPLALKFEDAAVYKDGSVLLTYLL